MRTKRSGHLGVQLLHNGKVLISGGTSGGQLVASAEVYDPVTGAFWPVDSPGTARRLFGASFFELPYTGILLAMGGLDGAETPLASSEVFFYPTLRSDKPDYAPGETVTLMGEGWRPNEQVAINIRESSGDPDTNLTAAADANGAFTNSEFQTNPDRSDVGVRFLATATGLASRWTAQTTFTDPPRNYRAVISPTTDTAGRTLSTYTITITNDSTSGTNANDVIGSVNVTIPTGYSNVVLGTVTASGGKTWTAIIVSGVIQLRAAGDTNRLSRTESVSVTLTATSPCTAGMYVWSTTAKPTTDFSGGTAFDLQGSQPTVTITGSCPTGADLSVTKTDGVTTVTAGDGVTRTVAVTVSNAGPSDATSVTLSDTWPGGFTRGTTTPSQGTCTTTTGQNFSCSLGTIPAGGGATVTVNYTVPASTPAGPQTNTVTVSSPVSDPNTANNTASDTNTVVTSADLSVTKTDGVTTVIAGDGVTRTYTITVSNTAGPSDATSVTLSDTWPSGFTRGTITPSQGTCTPAMTGQNFTCALGPLAKGGSATVTVNYTVPASTP